MRAYTFIANGPETITINARNIRRARAILKHLGFPHDAQFLISEPV